MAFGSLQGIIGRAAGNEVIGRGVIDVGVSSYRIRHDMRTVTKAINSESQLWGQAFKLAAVGVAALGAATVAAVVGGIASAEKFNAAMAKIAAFTTASKAEMVQLNASVLELAKTTPQGPEALAKALYYIRSAGFQGADAMKILELSSKSAAASGANMTDVAFGLVGMMNAWGYSVQNASVASDTLNQIVKEGHVNYEDLVKAIGRVSVFARIGGMSIQEMGAALASMTKDGLTARQSANALIASIRGLMKPNEAQWKMMKALGVQYDTSMLKAKGYMGVLKMLDAAARKQYGYKDITPIKYANGKINQTATNALLEKTNRGYYSVMGTLIGQQNALLVSQVLLTNNAKAYNDSLARMRGLSDETNKSFQRAKDMDIGIVFGIMASNVQVALIALGQKFMPVLRQVIEWMTTALPDAINHISALISNVLAPAFGNALAGIGKLLDALTQMVNFGGTGENNSPLMMLLTMFVALLAHGLDVIGSFAGALAGLIKMTGPLAQFAAAFTAIALAFSLIKTASAALASRAKGLAGALSFGQYKPGVQLSPESAALSEAGATQTSAAVKLIEAAVALNEAATMLMNASRFGMAGGRGMGSFKGAGGLYTGYPGWMKGAGFDAETAGFRNTLGPIKYGGTMGPHSPLVSSPFMRQQEEIVARQGALASEGLVKRTASGMVTKLGAVKSVAGNILSKGLGAASKVFWPLMIADIVGNMVKEPLGDIISNNPLTHDFFSNAGKVMKEDFWGGLIAVASDIFTGGRADFAATLAKTTRIGTLTLDTTSLQDFGLKTDQVDAIQKAQQQGIDTLATRLHDATAANDMVGKLGEGMAKNYSTYADTVIQNAIANGLDTAGTMTTSTPNRGSRAATTYNKAKIAALASSLGARIETNAKYANNMVISMALDILTTRLGISTSDLIKIPPGVLTQAATLLQTNISDAFNVAARYAIDKALTTKPKPIAPSDIDTTSKYDSQTGQWSKPNAGLASTQANIRGLNFDALQKTYDGIIKDAVDKSIAGGQTPAEAQSSVDKAVADMKDMVAKASAATTQSGKIDFLANVLGIRPGAGVKGAKLTAWVKTQWAAVLQDVATVTATGTPIAAQQSIANSVESIVTTGLQQGTSLVDVKKALGPLWYKMQVGTGLGTLETHLASAIQKAFSGAISQAVTPAQKTKLLASVNSLLAPLGAKFGDWKSFVKAFKNPAGLTAWLHAHTKTPLANAGTVLFNDPVVQARWVKGQKDLYKAITDGAKPNASKYAHDLGLVANLLKNDPGMQAAWASSGKTMIQWIADGMKANAGAMTSAMDLVLGGVLTHIPHSPVKAGPMKHPFLPNAGKMIVKQVASGMRSESLAMPGLTLAGKSSAHLGLSGAGASVQKIYADKLQVFSDPDEASILHSLQFMAPGGR